jgi:hypothetical protein
MNSDIAINKSGMKDQVQYPSRVTTLQSTSKKTRNLRHKRVHSLLVVVRRVFSLTKRRDSVDTQEFKQTINRIADKIDSIEVVNE